MQVDTKQLLHSVRRLELISSKSLRNAQLDTINDLAFMTKRSAERITNEDLTLRSRYMTKTMRVKRADKRSMTSTVGSLSEGLAKQEGGFTERASGSGVAVPTSYASGEKRAPKRLRQVRKANRVGNIRLDKTRYASRKQQNAAQVRQAVDGGNRYVYMDLGKVKGLFRVYGGKRKPQPQLIQSLSQKTVRVRGIGWLERAREENISKLFSTYSTRVQQQLKRL